MSSLPKPVLRGHLNRWGLKVIAGAVLFATFNCSMFHFLLAVPKRQKYEDFLKNYDAEAHYKALKASGYITPNEVYN